jgi:hypothetical protein
MDSAKLAVVTVVTGAKWRASRPMGRRWWAGKSGMRGCLGTATTMDYGLCGIASEKPDERPKRDDKKQAEPRGKAPAEGLRVTENRQAQVHDGEEGQIEGCTPKTGNWR